MTDRRGVHFPTTPGDRPLLASRWVGCACGWASSYEDWESHICAVDSGDLAPKPGDPVIATPRLSKDDHTFVPLPEDREAWERATAPPRYDDDRGSLLPSPLEWVPTGFPEMAAADDGGVREYDFRHLPLPDAIDAAFDVVRRDMAEMAASDPIEPLPTWPRHDPATGFGLALIVGAVVVGLVVAWRWLR